MSSSDESDTPLANFKRKKTEETSSNVQKIPNKLSSSSSSDLPSSDLNADSDTDPVNAVGRPQTSEKKGETALPSLTTTKSQGNLAIGQNFEKITNVNSKVDSSSSDEGVDDPYVPDMANNKNVAEPKKKAEKVTKTSKKKVLLAQEKSVTLDSDDDNKNGLHRARKPKIMCSSSEEDSEDPRPKSQESEASANRGKKQSKVVRRKVKTKRRAKIMSSSEEGGGSSSDEEPPATKSSSPNRPTSVQQDTSVKKPVLDDSSELLITSANLRLDYSDHQTVKAKEGPKLAMNSELFSAGESSGEENSGKEKQLESRLSDFSPIVVDKPAKCVSPGSSKFSGRRSSTPNDLPSKKRSKKKGEKSMRRGLRKDEQLQLQSDVQKRIREKPAPMPKYQPKQMTLAEILAMNKNKHGRRLEAEPEKLIEKVLPPSGENLNKSAGYVSEWLHNATTDGDDKTSKNSPDPEQSVNLELKDADDEYFPSLEELENISSKVLSEEISENTSNKQDPRIVETIETEKPKSQKDSSPEKVTEPKTARILKNLNLLGKVPKIRLESDQEVIDLEDESEKNKKSELDLWLDKKKRAFKIGPDPVKRNTSVGIVTVKKDENGKDILERNVRNLVAEPIEFQFTADPHKPGARRIQMQNALQESIARKRKEGLELRTQQYKEEMGEDLMEDENQEIEEPEAKEEDFSDFSDEDEEEEEEFEDADDDEEIVIRKRNPLIDEEAEESGDKILKEEEGDDDALNLHLGEGPETLETESLVLEPDSNTVSAPPSSHDATEFKASTNSELDLFAETLEDESDLRGADSQQPGFFSDTMEKMDDLRILSFPVQQSQTGFLLNDEERKQNSTNPADSSGDENRICLKLPDTLSQLEKSHHSHGIERSAESKKNTVESVPDELLLLCSGTFGTQESSAKMSPSPVPDTQPISQFSDDNYGAPTRADFSVDDENAREGFADVSDNDDEDENFVAVINRQKSMKSSKILSDDEEDDNNDAKSLPEFAKETVSEKEDELLSRDDAGNEDEYDENSGQGEKMDKIETTTGLDKCDGEASDCYNSDDELAVVRRLEEKEKRNKRLSMRDRKGKLRREFFEREAELSGSDAGSDEDELGSDDDVMEAEEGDLDNLPSEDELRRQIGRVHMKKEMDDDERRLLVLKEKYIEDRENENSQRKFRWRRQEGDDEFDAEMSKRREFGGGTEWTEEEEGDLWAKQRVEKAKWQLENRKSPEDEILLETESQDSAILKFGKLATRKLSTPSQASVTTSTVQITTLLEARSISVPNGNQVNTVIRQPGSLLGRDSALLGSVAKANINTAVVDSRKGVFARISPGKEATNEKKRKSSAVVRRMKEEIKKPKIVNQDSNSLFDLLSTDF